LKISKNWLCEEFVDISDIPDMVLLQRMGKIGHSLRLISAQSDTILDVDIPTQRPDFFSVIGVAREIAAAFNKSLHVHVPSIQADDIGSIYEMLDADIWAEELCNRLSVAIVSKINNGSSPNWLQDRLVACGIQCKNLLCDIANYVMLEYGQPILVVDYRAVASGQLSLRESFISESFIADNDNLYVLPQGIPILDDGETAIAAAGIIPAQNVLPSEDTKTAVFIAGNYPVEVIRNAAAELRISTPSVERFSLSIDPLLTMTSILRACELVQKLGCGKVMDGTLDLLNYVPNEKVIALDPETINQLLNKHLTNNTILRILRSLEIPSDGNIVEIPSRCPYLQNITDLATEIGRIYNAYEN